jgi:hypothetical protein
MTATKNFAAEASPAQSGNAYAKLYAEHFVPQHNAVHGNAPAQAMPSAPFKIFSMTNDNVNIIYSNKTGM